MRLLSLPEDFAYAASARRILARSSGDKALFSFNLLSSEATDELASESVLGV